VSLGNGQALLMTSDPLSLIPSLGLRESAWLSVQLMANDMATSGFAPQFVQFTLNLPPNLSVADFEQYWRYIHEFCTRLGIAITGGHTGRFEGQNSTVCGGGTMVTVAPAEQVITSKGASPGDLLVMTKTAALISTAILALSFPRTIRRELGIGVAEEVSGLFYESSAVEAGLLAGEINQHMSAVTAMHDVTEGGVLGAAFELAAASKTGVEIYRDRIPVTDSQRSVCDLFEIDPFYCVGAGSMLIAVKPDKAESVVKRLETNKIKATTIGRMTEEGSGLSTITSTSREQLVHPGKDPYWEAFQTAIRNGWE
jgi:hydrogenase expression/formation protein HypE